MTHAQNRPLLEIAVPQERLSDFFPLLGGGFGLHTQVGLTLTEWFGRQPGLSVDYLQERVQTIFLDGRAVDDAERAVIRDGATLALSAAMPGLVGATFRKGGRYAALRSTISLQAQEPEAGAARGLLTLKLFNMVAAEIGPAFLRRAVRLPGGRLADFLDHLPRRFRQEWRSVRYEGQQAAFPDLVRKVSEAPWVWLKITHTLS